MTVFGKRRSGRDRKIPIAFAFLMLCMFATLYQAFILKLYITTAVMGDWKQFSKVFSVPLPVKSDQFCFDYCAPKLPFFWGWVGIASFVSAAVIIAYCWWKSTGDEHSPAKL
jgi:hypothetical protein